MPRFKGNEGNLMQHWVLCELLTSAQDHTSHLTYIDAHSMAPIANLRTGKSRKFDAVFKRLPEQNSLYEQAWEALSPEQGTYPNSANFLAHLWRQPRVCSMLLCEKDEETVSLLRSWTTQHSGIKTEVHYGDWRMRFEYELPKSEGLIIVSFDPYMFNRHARNVKPENMYPTDLDRLVKATRSYPSNILLQLSTYSTNGGNGQEQTAEVIQSKLAPGGFDEVAIIRPHGGMMSLIYQRGITFSGELTSLPSRFKEWFDSI